MPEAPRTEVRGEGVDLAGHLALAGEAARREHEFPLVDLNPPELADQRPVQPGPRVRRVLRESGIEEPLDLRPMPAAQRQETRISLERPRTAPYECLAVREGADLPGGGDLPLPSAGEGQSPQSENPDDR